MSAETLGTGRNNFKIQFRWLNWLWDMREDGVQEDLLPLAGLEHEQVIITWDKEHMGRSRCVEVSDEMLMIDSAPVHPSEFSEPHSPSPEGSLVGHWSNGDGMREEDASFPCGSLPTRTTQQGFCTLAIAIDANVFPPPRTSLMQSLQKQQHQQSAPLLRALSPSSADSAPNSCVL